MAINDIIIKEGSLQKISDNKGKLNLTIYSLDESNDMEPAAGLKLYINNSLVKTLLSNEIGIAKEDLIINTDSNDVKVQVKDLSETIQSKIKVIFSSGEIVKDLENSEKHEDINNQNTINFSDIDKQKVFDQVSKNGLLLGRSDNIKYNTDFDIVLAAVKQNGDAILYADKFFLTDYNILVNAYINKEDSLNKLWEANKDNKLMVDYINKIQNFFSSGKVSDDNLLSSIKNNKEAFYILVKKSKRFGFQHQYKIVYNLLNIIPVDLWSDKDFILNISSHFYPDIFPYLPGEVKNDEDAFLVSLKSNPTNQGFQYAPQSLKNRNFIVNELALSGKYDIKVLNHLDGSILSIDDRIKIMGYIINKGGPYDISIINFSYQEVISMIESGKSMINKNTHILSLSHISNISNIEYYVRHSRPDLASFYND